MLEKLPAKPIDKDLIPAHWQFLYRHAPGLEIVQIDTDAKLLAFKLNKNHTMCGRGEYGVEVFAENGRSQSHLSHWGLMMDGNIESDTLDYDFSFGMHE